MRELGAWSPPVTIVLSLLYTRDSAMRETNSCSCMPDDPMFLRNSWYALGSNCLSLMKIFSLMCFLASSEDGWIP